MTQKECTMSAWEAQSIQNRIQVEFKMCAALVCYGIFRDVSQTDPVWSTISWLFSPTYNLSFCS